MFFFAKAQVLNLSHQNKLYSQPLFEIGKKRRLKIICDNVLINNPKKCIITKSIDPCDNFCVPSRVNLIRKQHDCNDMTFVGL